MLTFFCFLQLQTFFSLYGSCQGVCVLKHLSILSCPVPRLKVAEVKIELVLTLNRRPVSHLGKEVSGLCGQTAALPFICT